MKIGFELSNCKPHGEAFYGPLVETFSKEFGSDFETFDSAGYDGLKRFDGQYDLIIVKGRRASQTIVSDCRISKSFLIDHAPIYSNRAPVGCGHFEIFSSPLLKGIYQTRGFRPIIKAYCGGYFLTDYLDRDHPEKGSCLVYLIHWKWARANSHDEIPFSDRETIAFLANLSQLFTVVYVVCHVSNEIDNFVVRYRSDLPSNVCPIQQGQEFLRLICNVGAIIFEYSSVFATGLWNPRIPIFQRRPPRPRGPSKTYAVFFHQLMNWVSYPIAFDKVESIPEQILRDPKKEIRQVRDLIYDPQRMKSPTKALVEAVRDALTLVTTQGWRRSIRVSPSLRNVNGQSNKQVTQRSGIFF